MSWAIGTLAAVLYVVARDLPRLSARSILALLGAIAWPMLAIAALDEVVARARPGWIREVVWRRAAVALVTFVPLGLGLWRWWGVRADVPVHAPIVFAVVAVGLAVALDRLARLPLADHPEHAGPGRVWAAALIAAAFTWMHRATGTLEAVREGTGLLHVGLFAGTMIASGALLLPLGARAGLHRRAEPTILRPAIAAFALVAGLALLEADRRALVGLYAPVHRWLAAMGLLSVDVAVGSLVARRPHRALRVAGFASLAALVVLGAFARPSRLADPVVRAEIAPTPAGASVLEVLGTRGGGRRREKPPEHPALRFERHLDEKPPTEGLSVLLVTIDALRADRIGPTGSPNADAPRLEAFAAGAVRFRRAYAQGSRTAVAMGALMLGRYSADIDWQLWPYAGGHLYDPKKTSKKTLERLKNRFVYSTLPAIPKEGTLAERLQRAGFFTLAAPFAGNNEFFRKGFGFDRGFDRFADLSRKGWKPPSSDLVADVAIEQIQQLEGRRFFQWVHLYDTHESGGNPQRYDRHLRAVDAAFGRILDALEKKGVLDRTAVVVMADHGESLGERGGTSHGTSLYEEQVRIPLLVRIPGVPARDEPRPVAAIDVTATLLALGGASTAGLDGVNLLPLLTRGAYPEGRPVFTEIHRYVSNRAERTVDIKSVVIGDLKLIVDRRRSTTEIYDLASDPLELKNLVATRPDDLARLSSILDSFIGRAEADHPLP